jgi:CheY-like chemotaxis protein
MMPTTLSPFVLLLAEDEPADAHLVQVALKENRILADLYHVLDGREALEFLRQPQQPRPNLILLDLNMPRMDGRECLAAIKSDPAIKDIPVVILTTSDVERDIVSAYTLGAAGFITKPMDLEQFIKSIGGLGDYWIHLVRLPHMQR